MQATYSNILFEQRNWSFAENGLCFPVGEMKKTSMPDLFKFSAPKKHPPSIMFFKNMLTQKIHFLIRELSL